MNDPNDSPTEGKRPPAEKTVFFLLVAAAVVAAGIDLLVAWQLTLDVDVVNYHLLAFCAVYLLIDRRTAAQHQPAPRLRPVRWWSLMGGSLLLTSALCKSLTMVKDDDYRHFLPLIFALGLGAVVFGFGRTVRVWKVIVILGLISILDLPFRSTVLGPMHLNELGAQISANLLLLVGYPAVASADQVILPTGSVEVFGPCSSVSPIRYLLKLSFLVLMIFPSRWWQKLAIVSLGVIIAIFFNAVRISVMAVLSAAGDHARFDYWHIGGGSNVFSFLYATLFGFGCMLLLRARTGVDRKEDIP
jgi:cyanoexosortase A